MRKIFICMMIGLFCMSISACVTKEDHTYWENIEITDEIENAVHCALVGVADDNLINGEYHIVAEEHKIFEAKKNDDKVMVYVVECVKAMSSYEKPEKISDMEEYYGTWNVKANILFTILDEKYICEKIDEGEDGELSEESFKERFPDEIISEVESYTDKLHENVSRERMAVENSLNKQIEEYISNLNCMISNKSSTNSEVNETMINSEDDVTDNHIDEYSEVLLIQ